MRCAFNMHIYLCAFSVQSMMKIFSGVHLKPYCQDIRVDKAKPNWDQIFPMVWCMGSGLFYNWQPSFKVWVYQIYHMDKSINALVGKGERGLYYVSIWERNDSDGSSPFLPIILLGTCSLVNFEILEALKCNFRHSSIPKPHKASISHHAYHVEIYRFNKISCWMKIPRGLHLLVVLSLNHKTLSFQILDRVSWFKCTLVCLKCLFDVLLEGEHPISELKVGDWFKGFIDMLISTVNDCCTEQKCCLLALTAFTFTFPALIYFLTIHKLDQPSPLSPLLSPSGFKTSAFASQIIIRCGQQSARMAVIEISAPLSILVLALVLTNSQLNERPKAAEPPKYGLNCTFARKTITSTGWEAILVHSWSPRSRRLAIFSPKENTLTGRLLLSLLLLNGNIEVNPGPKLRYPCGMCSKAVTRNQRGIQCVGCDVWFHTKCMQMSSQVYEALANSSCTWVCSNCGLPNFSSSLFESPADIGVIHSNLFSPLSTPQELNTSSLPSDCTFPKPNSSSSPKYTV